MGLHQVLIQINKEYKKTSNNRRLCCSWFWCSNIRTCYCWKICKVGANAVVTKDVPENAVMVGIPAKNVGIADSEFKPYGITPDSDTKSD